jgi:hypothetical protein
VCKGAPFSGRSEMEMTPIGQGETIMIVSSFDSKDLTLFTAVLDQACSDEGVLDESRRRRWHFRSCTLRKPESEILKH